MLKNLTISGFRTFRELHVDRLTRVNLFVGTNNAGKTSILEAAEVLTIGKAHGLLESPSRRGEEISARDNSQGGSKTEVDPSHLFYGHVLKPDISFSISGQGDRKLFVQVSLSPGEELESASLFVHYKSHIMDGRFPISPSGGLQIPYRLSLLPTPVNFLGSEAIERDRLGKLWDEVVLEPDEKGVTEALRIIDPRIERIAFTVDSNIFLKLSDSEQRLPLGSVGDGLKRLLALALHLFSAKEGFLLVDEIDTGLHHTVMVNMWKLVIETARRLDVQVLATSHSLDCVRALAWVREQNPDLASDVTLHRVEKGATKTVAFTSDELLVAARNHLELR